MRILVTRGVHGQPQRGSIAVLSAILVVAIVGMAAFTVDLGQAYVSKRQLQTASDAAALAAASVMAKAKGTCSTLANPLVADSATAQANARVDADKIRESNRPGSTRSGIVSFSCSVDNKALEVSYSSAATVNSIFGNFWNLSSITSTRSATASVSVAPEGNNLRPYMICSNYVPTTTLPSSVVKVDFPTSSDTSGSCPHSNGNWFTVDCPHAGNGDNSNSVLAASTANGCDPSHPIAVVSPQNPSTPATLASSLVAACPASANSLSAYDPDCLTSDPGNLGGSEVITAWNGLIALHKPILFPVFCGTPTCSPAGWSEGQNGNTTMYPVYALAAAQVCGYHWGNKDSGTYTSVGAGDLCAGSPDASLGNNSDNYLLLAFTQVMTTGSTGTSECGLGLGCDGGARRVLLVK